MLGCVIWSLAALVSSKRSAKAPTALEQLAEGELHTPEEFSSVEPSSSSLSAPLSSSLSRSARSRTPRSTMLEAQRFHHRLGACPEHDRLISVACSAKSARIRHALRVSCSHQHHQRAPARPWPPRLIRLRARSRHSQPHSFFSFFPCTTWW